MRVADLFAPAVCLSVLVAVPAGAQPLADPLPPIPVGDLTLRLETVVSGLSYPMIPTEVVSPRDGSGRLFVVGLGGEVIVIHPDNTTAHFLDTTVPDTKINPANYGMIAMAFHPGFADPTSPGHRRFYTITTERNAGGTPDFGTGTEHHDVIYEWQVDANDPNAVNFSAKREVLRITQPRPQHNVAHLAFTPDGLLWIASGDGGNNSPGSSNYSDSGQITTDIYATILRIDPLALNGALSANGQYSIPPDNFFVGNPAGIDEIYAWGARSPYRLIVHPNTGDVYFGDVGQLNIEEINRIDLDAPPPNGWNFGWNIKEGTFLYNIADQSVSLDPAPDPDLIDPFAQYDHGDGRSIVAGYFYRGGGISGLQGQMLLGDYQGPFGGNNRQCRLFRMNAATGALDRVSIDPSGAPLPRLLLTFGEGEDGTIYIAGTNLDGSDNVILRVMRSCPADITGEGVVDINDFIVLASNFGATSGATRAQGDLNADGVVDINDFIILAADFGCGS